MLHLQVAMDNVEGMLIADALRSCPQITRLFSRFGFGKRSQEIRTWHQKHKLNIVFVCAVWFGRLLTFSLPNNRHQSGALV
jgi:hypothetical protein